MPADCLCGGLDLADLEAAVHFCDAVNETVYAVAESDVDEAGDNVTVATLPVQVMDLDLELEVAAQDPRFYDPLDMGQSDQMGDGLIVDGSTTTVMPELGLEGDREDAVSGSGQEDDVELTSTVAADYVDVSVVLQEGSAEVDQSGSANVTLVLQVYYTVTVTLYLEWC